MASVRTLVTITRAGEYLSPGVYDLTEDEIADFADYVVRLPLDAQGASRTAEDAAKAPLGAGSVVGIPAPPDTAEGITSNRFSSKRA